MKNAVGSIGKALNKAFEANGWLTDLVPDFDITHPKDEQFGDYTTNIALALAKKVGENPRAVADKLITVLQNDIENDGSIQRVEVAGAGFINFYLSDKWLLNELKMVTEGYGRNDKLNNQKVIVEYTDPNPFKEFHIGHMMSNTIGESIARLIEAQGAEVKRANYQGDVGLHVAKSIWGMQQKLKAENLKIEELAKWGINTRQSWMGQAYAQGATAYEEDEIAKAAMQALNKKIYQQTETEIMALYRAGRDWSLQYFETIYARLGTKFDEYFFESETGKLGLDVVEEAIKTGILEKGDDGAIVYKGEKDGLHTRVFRNKLGLPTYEAKDLGLAKAKYGRYQYDKSIIVTANEITEYFKVVLKVMEKLYPELRAKTTHLPHGIMKLTTGKMSSRTGKVVSGESLLGELKAVVLEKMGDREIADKEKVADMIAVGALKYTVLKQQIGGDIVYDPEKMTNLQGDTGPYIQYTFARTQSVIDKAASKPAGNDQRIGKSVEQMESEEIGIMRWIYRYPEVVAEAGRTYSPHLVASFIYELAGRYNAFYNKHKIVGGENEELRLQLTKAVGQILKSGLGLLGIVALREM